MTRAVHLRHAVALAGRFPALAGVDLSVESGEVVVLVGPNGAGKTSLLRACAGLLPLTQGEAIVLGCDLMRNRSAVRRQVGMLGHSPALYDDLTVKENVRFALRASGASDVSVTSALERVGLVGRLSRTPASRLSAGQRKRVGLAFLAARRSPLWLLDEPHAGLDVTAREVLAEMVGEAAAAGTSVLIASHELSVSAPLADRVAQMSGGRVVGELDLDSSAGTGSGSTASNAATTSAPVPAPAAPVPAPAAPVTSRSRSDVSGGVNVA
ncbi:MAG: heme ABC exporter ATP-binding protein CcmA [Acidimicrobiales bacterium]